MANLYFNNAVDSNLNTVGNWWTNSGCTTPAGRVPTTGDDVFTGTASPDFVTGGTVVADNMDLNVTINGGTFNVTMMTTGSSMNISDGIFNGFLTFTAGSMNGGTYNGEVLNSSATINDGTFNGVVTCQPAASLFGGTYNGTVYANGSIGNGIFNEPIEIDTSASISGGTFNDAVSIASIHAGVGFVLMSMSSTARIRFDGGSYFYRSTSTGVAAAEDVRDGTFNLGVEGTLEVSEGSSSESVGHLGSGDGFS